MYRAGLWSPQRLSLPEKLSSAKCPKSSASNVLQEFREKFLWQEEILKDLGEVPRPCWTSKDT